MFYKVSRFFKNDLKCSSPKMNVKGQAPAIAQENQQIGGESLTHTRSHTHFSITECSTK